MSQIDQLHARREANSLEIVSLKKKLEQLELDQHEINIAIRVISSLTTQGPISGQLNVSLSSVAVAASGAVGRLRNGKPTVKQLISDALMMTSSPLTKMDLVSRLATAGHEVNSTTVGTTLSKMVAAKELEVVDVAGRLTAYQIKGEEAQGKSDPAPSGATKSDKDKL